MLVKRFNRESAVMFTIALTFFPSIFIPVLAQSDTNSKATPHHHSKTSAPHTKTDNAFANTPMPPFQRRRGRLSAEEVKAAGIDSNKFYHLAELKEKAGKLDEAKQLYYKAVVSRSDVWGQYDPAVAKISIKIGQIELKQKHPKTARTWFKQALNALSKRFGSGDYELVPVLTILAKLESNENDHEAASSYYDHILLLQERKFGQESPEAVQARISYIQELIADKDPAEAEKIADRAIEIEEKARGAASQDLPKLKQLLSTAQAARANNSSK
jgi:hypothetical protein